MIGAPILFQGLTLLATPGIRQRKKRFPSRFSPSANEAGTEKAISPLQYPEAVLRSRRTRLMPDSPSPKRPFLIGPALQKVRRAVRGYPKAALFELADEGFGSVFEILIACIISIRTRD